jgi:hypothetical protein
MLEVIRTADGGVTRQEGTYTRYDSRGREGIGIRTGIIRGERPRES